MRIRAAGSLASGLALRAGPVEYRSAHHSPHVGQVAEGAVRSSIIPPPGYRGHKPENRAVGCSGKELGAGAMAAHSQPRRWAHRLPRQEVPAGVVVKHARRSGTAGLRSRFIQMIPLHATAPVEERESSVEAT